MLLERSGEAEHNPGPNLARYCVKREKARFVNHDVSFGCRRMVKAPIEQLREAEHNPVSQISPDLERKQDL